MIHFGNPDAQKGVAVSVPLRHSTLASPDRVGESAERDITTDCGRSRGAVPNALFGSGPILKVNVPPAMMSGWVMYDFV